VTIKVKKVLILGSGGIKIGQAGEFDYSGSQAIKALKQSNIQTVLVNPNIATIQTDANLADIVYFQPLNLQTVSKIIEKEKPDGILLGFGGQTALNLGIELSDANILKKYNIEVLGTCIDSIRKAEDREEFKDELEKISVKTPLSIACKSLADAQKAVKKIGFPIMLRAGFSLGGLGSGIISNLSELKKKAKEALSVVDQILIEEYLYGWKELEYEVIRDANDQALSICNMENFDPLGIHTGESIVIAPSQTLNNYEYHFLRSIAINIAKHFKVIGECNVQFALDPESGDYRVIEMNPRLSRSSALASKATGYPLAFVAAKLAIGYRLDQIPNSITEKTSAFFEPALDYLVIKIPRWDTNKLKDAERRIGTEMKSVGEVMAIGRSFPEALQKAIRMLNIGAEGIDSYPYHVRDLEKELTFPTDRRLFALYLFLKENNKQQPYFSNPSKTMPTPQNAAAPFKFSNNILHKIQKKLSTAAAFLDSDIEKLRHELTEAIQDPEKVEVGITWYLSLSKNRRESITKTVGAIICALRDSYAQESVKSLHNAKEREIEAIEIKQKKQQQEIQQKIDDPVDNALMFKKTVDILSTIDGIRVKENVIYYDYGRPLEQKYGAFRTVMPNGKIFYGKNGSVKCKFDFNIPRNEFTRGIYWFMEYFKPLLSAN